MTLISIEIIERYGFKRINNSMWKLGKNTLQSYYTTHGDDLMEKILNLKKGFKLCINGKFFKMILCEADLYESIKNLKP